MKKSMLAIAFAVASSIAFAQTAPAQNPPAASGSTAQTGKTTKKPKVKKHNKKPATNNTTGTDAGKTGK